MEKDKDTSTRKKVRRSTSQGSVLKKNLDERPYTVDCASEGQLRRRNSSLPELASPDEDKRKLRSAHGRTGSKNTPEKKDVEIDTDKISKGQGSLYLRSPAAARRKPAPERLEPIETPKDKSSSFKASRHMRRRRTCDLLLDLLRGRPADGRGFEVTKDQLAIPQEDMCLLARAHKLPMSEVKRVATSLIKISVDGIPAEEAFAGWLSRVFEVRDVGENTELVSEMRNLAVAFKHGTLVYRLVTLHKYLKFLSAHMYNEVGRLVGDGSSGATSAPAMVIAKVRQEFAIFDADGSGEIDFEEFKQLLPVVAKVKHLSEEQIYKLWEECDTDGGGTVDFNEFLAWYTFTSFRTKTLGPSVKMLCD
eukprot:TRINITY_DN19348_c0_g1_i1.p1 TRINITY_DN19348_c0_g1~~TRINITY_DN19348_c0_g1_i1.p1  ORF type:complete len:363 (+),score=77.35 TRINITY_DN19348_c0_g1_i1:115-1203(+)